MTDAEKEKAERKQKLAERKLKAAEKKCTRAMDELQIWDFPLSALDIKYGFDWDTYQIFGRLPTDKRLELFRKHKVGLRRAFDDLFLGDVRGAILSAIESTGLKKDIWEAENDQETDPSR